MPGTLDRWHSELESEMKKSMEFAIAAPYPGIDKWNRMSMPETTERELTFGQAIREALAEEMRRDPTSAFWAKTWLRRVLLSKCSPV